MAQATGIGGVFFRARDPEALAAWYAEHLGVAGGASGVPWQQAAGDTVFAPFPAYSDYFPEDRAFMLNFRVDDLDGLLARLEEAGIAAETRAEWDGPHGRFARIHDPEGNPVELWQPPA
jgi:catechol 2,3-dioxygenase-like lactoylglutathione lyase family enzyme